jgi:hypothetical protein
MMVTWLQPRIGAPCDRDIYGEVESLVKSQSIALDFDLKGVQHGTWLVLNYLERYIFYDYISKVDHNVIRIHSSVPWG